MAERSKAAVSKTVNGIFPFGGSNPPLSAIFLALFQRTMPEAKLPLRQCPAEFGQADIAARQHGFRFPFRFSLSPFFSGAFCVRKTPAKSEPARPSSLFPRHPSSLRAVYAAVRRQPGCRPDGGRKSTILASVTGLKMTSLNPSFIHSSFASTSAVMAMTLSDRKRVSVRST